jgi:hypothetical protein
MNLTDTYVSMQVLKGVQRAGFILLFYTYIFVLMYFLSISVINKFRVAAPI